MRRSLAVPAVLVTLLLAVTLAVAAWASSTESDYFLYSPQEAQQVGPLVKVPGEPPDPTADEAGILLVAIGVRRASRLDRWLADPDEGVDLVPEEQVLPAGADDEELGRLGRVLMHSSQQAAAVVAERALGRRVEIVQTATIAEFASDSPARRAGLRTGDVIVRAGGRAVESLDDLRAALAKLRPRTAIEIAFRRDGRVRTTSVTTLPNPEYPDRAVLGVVIEPAEVKLAVPVDYLTQGIGGPSAGLAFALEIYSDLAGRSVVKGHRVAVTGEIGLDGTVGPIGGIKQKTIGAAESDADVFLVPKENAPEARRWARDGLQVVAVGTFSEALGALAALPAA